MVLLRPAARLVGVIWTLAIALLGLGIAAYCLDGLIGLGSARPDRVVGLPVIHRRVGGFLDQLAARGPVALLSLLCGVGAILLGVLLLVGIFRRYRERLAVLDANGTAGVLAARRGVLRDMAAALAEQPHQATAVRRPRLSLARRGERGRLTLRTERSALSTPEEVQQAVEQAVAPVTEPFSLRVRVRVSLGGRGARAK